MNLRHVEKVLEHSETIKAMQEQIERNTQETGKLTNVIRYLFVRVDNVKRILQNMQDTP